MKTKIALLSCIAILYAAVMIVLVCTARDSNEEADLLRERVSLLEDQNRALKELAVKTEMLCTHRIAMGDVCRTAFKDLVQRLGLDRRGGSAARAVLNAFDGLGGPDD